MIDGITINLFVNTIEKEYKSVRNSSSPRNKWINSTYKNILLKIIHTQKIKIQKHVMFTSLCQDKFNELYGWIMIDNG